MLIASPSQWGLLRGRKFWLIESKCLIEFKLISAELRSDLLAYYSDPSAPIVTKKKATDWARVTKELAELKSLPSRPLTRDVGPAN